MDIFRYDLEGCSYLYDIDAHIDDGNARMFDGRMPYVIDATKYGNVARFINHRFQFCLKSLVLGQNYRNFLILVTL